MNSNPIYPPKSEKFLESVFKYLEKFKGHRLYDFILDDYFAKVEQKDAGYGRWLSHLVPYLCHQYNLGEDPKILDFGCGTGAMTVLINSLGFHAVGIDIHQEHLNLANVLAEENNLPKTTFVLADETDKNIPLPDKSFVIILLFVVVEHLSDKLLNYLLPELNRICSGVVYVVVPNKLNLIDDHTGLRFVPWMPRWLAERYVKFRGDSYRYILSQDESWDVHYRTFNQVVSLFKNHNFRIEFPLDEVVFPPIEICKPIWISQYGGRLYTKPFYFLLRLVGNILLNLGQPVQSLYPYINLIFIPQESDDKNKV